MVTPYDWQEAIGHRAQYVEARLAGGLPIVATSLAEGLLTVTLRRNSRKIFDIYDRLMFAGIGLTSDLEALRIAAIEYSHREGFLRSEKDVTVQRVVGALGQSVKRAFGDFSTTPMVVRALFAEVGSSPEKDALYVLEYDGDYAKSTSPCLLAGSGATSTRLAERIEATGISQDLQTAMEGLEDALRDALGNEESHPDLQMEAALLSRDENKARRFQLLTKGS